MKCKHCGKDLLEGAKFCVYCGKPIELEQPKPVEDVAVAPQTVNNVVEEPKTISTSQQPVVDQQNQVAENIPQQPLPIINNTNEQKVTQSPVQPLENNVVQNSMPIQQEIPKIEEPKVQQTIEEPTVNPIQSSNMEEKNVNAVKTNEVLQPIEEVKHEPSIIDMVTPEPVVKDTNDTLMQQDTLIEEQPVEQNVPTPIELPKEEQNNNVQPEVVTKVVKKNNPILIVIIFILLAIIIGGGIFVYTKYIANDTSNSNSKKQSNIDNAAEVKDEKEDGELDLTKSLNTENINYSNATALEGDYGLTMNINPDKKSITLNIDWTKFGPLSTATTYTGNEEYQIAGFSKEISDTFIGSLGQDSMGITLFYLMNDGTVEYTPMFVKRQDAQGNTQYETNFSYDMASDGNVGNLHFETNGTIPNVSDVIKMYTVDAYAQTGGKTTIGVLKNGSFYDLGYAINN